MHTRSVTYILTTIYHKCLFTGQQLRKITIVFRKLEKLLLYSQRCCMRIYVKIFFPNLLNRIEFNGNAMIGFCDVQSFIYSNIFPIHCIFRFYLLINEVVVPLSTRNVSHTLPYACRLHRLLLEIVIFFNFIVMRNNFVFSFYVLYTTPAQFDFIISLLCKYNINIFIIVNLSIEISLPVNNINQK